MPPSGYLTASGVESCLQYLANTYSSICQLITMPEPSIEGRTIHAIKIASGAGTDRHGALLIGGVHARELINPDLLVSLALDLCRAYTNSSSLTYGPKTYDASTVRLIVESKDLFILPLVNPDGRVFVQAPAGDPWWRKNRNPNPGLSCMGVDINRNYDFLWSSGIGTSGSDCSDIFKGQSAFSEPETRNVRHLLDNYSNICCMMDVHSYSQLVLYPWGDDDNQTTDTTMNFRNASYNGLRGTSGDSIYREYIPQRDADWFANTGIAVRDAIAAVRGRTYTVEQGILLYPTSGTSDDYAYSRDFVDPARRRVLAYTLETGTEFQPPYSEALEVIREGSSGIIEFCIACLCVVEETVRGTALAAELDEMRTFRDEVLLKSTSGRRYVALLESNSTEIVQLLGRDTKLQKQALDLLGKVHRVARTYQDAKPRSFDAALIRAANQLLERIAKAASPSLKDAMETAARDLPRFRGKTVLDGLQPSGRRRAKAAQKLKRPPVRRR